ncbi:hypothetical protein ACIO3O_04070 [Streptomyces sp. NPDC087440]|uniref:hypothetical protein n=1 Tax=Streptomyces sp. NPDC087440 TaxID=3365790 RepID=UPI003828A61D
MVRNRYEPIPTSFTASASVLPLLIANSTTFNFAGVSRRPGGSPCEAARAAVACSAAAKAASLATQPCRTWSGTPAHTAAACGPKP